MSLSGWLKGKVAEREADSLIGGLSMSPEWKSYLSGLVHNIIDVALVGGFVLYHTSSGAIDWRISLSAGAAVLGKLVWNYYRQNTLPPVPWDGKDRRNGQAPK